MEFDERNGEEDGESAARRELRRWLDTVDDWESVQKEKEGEEPLFPSRPGRGILRKMAPQESLDLHGMGAEEAEKALRNFIHTAHSRKLKKVLIIHGKGNHSSGGPVIKTLVRSFLEKSPLAGEMGTPGRELGGSGATWVILK